MKTVEFMDEVKKRYKLTSDYKLAKFLDIRQTTVSNYRLGKTFFDDAIAIKVAELLKLDPGHVLPYIHAERAKRPEVKKAWEHIAQMLQRSRRAAAAIFIGVFAFFLMGTPESSHAAPPDNGATTVSNVYYVK